MELDEPLPEVMTLNEVAAAMKVSRATVLSEHERDPLFPRYRRIGRQYRFKRSDVAAYLADSRCTQPIPGQVA